MSGLPGDGGMSPTRVVLACLLFGCSADEGVWVSQPCMGQPGTYTGTVITLSDSCGDRAPPFIPEASLTLADPEHRQFFECREHLWWSMMKGVWIDNEVCRLFRVQYLLTEKYGYVGRILLEIDCIAGACHREAEVVFR
jgi:hypothetical protein